MDQASPAAQAETAARDALAACTEHDTWLPIGLLPADARRRLLGLAGAAVPQPIAARLAELPDYHSDTAAAVVLTRRERVLLPMLAGPLSVPEIAAGQHVSVNTVRKQVVALRAKLGAANRAELVRLARRAGLI